MEQSIRQKEEDQKLQILLANPELYKQMEKTKEEEVENASFEEIVNEDGVVMSSMTYEEFQNIVKMQNEINKNAEVIYKTEGGSVVYDREQGIFPEDNILQDDNWEIYSEERHADVH